MAKTTRELCISISVKELEAILAKVLSDKFSANSSIKIEFITGTKYSGPGDEYGTEVVKEVMVRGTEVSEIKL